MIEDLLNYLETTSLEPHDDYTSEFTYKEQKELYKYIKNLQKENEMLHHYKTLYQSLKRQKEDLKEWLEESKKISSAQHHVIGVSICNIVMSKIEELEQEGVNNE